MFYNLKFGVEIPETTTTTTTEIGGFDPVKDGIVEPYEKHFERRIIELCGGIAAKGLVGAWVDELFMLLHELELKDK